MSANIGSVEMTIRAIDEASAALDRVKGNISGLGTAADTTTKKMDSINKVDYTKAIVGISGLVTSALAFYNSVDRIEKAQTALDKASLRVSNDTDLVAKAQERYNEAVAKFGEDSPQAIQAATDLGQAIEKLRIDTEVVEQRQSDYNKALVTAAATVIPTAITGYASLKSIMAGLGTATTGAGTAASGASGGISSLGAALGTVGIAAAGIVLDVRGLWEEFDNLKKSIDEGDLSIGHLNESLLMISNPFLTMNQGATEFLKDLGLLPKQLPSIGEMITGWFDFVNQKATEAFNGLVAAVTGVVPQITSALTGFIDSMKSLFQGFYNWLIGGSLWRDLWTGVLNSTTQAIGQLVGNVTSQLFQPLQAGFTGLMQGIQSVWQGGLAGLSQALGGFAASAQGTLSGIIGSIQGAVSQVQTALGGIWGGITSALGFGAPAATTSGYDLAHTAAQLAAGPEWPGMQIGLTERDKELMGLATTAEVMADTVQEAAVVVTEAIEEIPVVVVPAIQTVVTTMTTANQTIIKSAQKTRDVMSRHSIWPEMMNEMVQMTISAMSALISTMETAFAKVIAKAQETLAKLQQLAAQAAAMGGGGGGGWGGYGGSAITSASQAAFDALKAAQEAEFAKPNLAAGWVPSTSMNLSGQQLAAYGQNLAEAIFQATYGRSSSLGPATTAEVLHATLPVNVVVDGVTVSRVVESRQLTQQRLSSYR